MIPSDREKFYNFISQVFLEEWQKHLSTEQLSRWFKTFEVHNLERFKKAFEKYLCDGVKSKFAPKEGQILEIIEVVSLDAKSIRCTWKDCPDFGDERIGDYFYCREHCDEMILKTQPDSIQAEVIANARRLQAEAKAEGLTGLEYFKKSEPEFYKSILKMRGQNKSEAVELRIIKSIGDLCEKDVAKSDRDRILGKVESIVRYYKLREESAETC